MSKADRDDRKERRRQRHRECVRILYQRQMRERHELRELVDELEVEYKNLLTLRATHPTHAVVDNYVLLTKQKDKLRKENNYLRQRLIYHEQFHRKAGIAIEAELRYFMCPSGTFDANRIIIRIPSHDDCARVARDACYDLLSFKASANDLSTGMVVFGWRDRWKPTNPGFRISIGKEFQHHDPATMCNRTWEVYSSAESVNTLITKSIQYQLHDVIKLDDHNYIGYRVVRNAEQLIIAQSLFLCSKVSIENGYAMVFRSIDPSCALHFPNGLEPTGSWLDISTWITFEETGAEKNHCIFEFGAIVKHDVFSLPQLYVAQALISCFRWENAVVGPLLSLA